MIFVTVGTQVPFDRMLKTIDAWAGAEGKDHKVFAQIGEGAWQPQHIESAANVTPTEFKQHMQAADVIIAHAGMGTILTALQFGKPLVVIPRRAALGEQRNDHQLATAKHLGEQGLVTVVDDEEQLRECLRNLDRITAKEVRPPHASDRLLTKLRAFITAK